MKTIKLIYYMIKDLWTYNGRQVQRQMNIWACDQLIAYVEAELARREALKRRINN